MSPYDARVLRVTLAGIDWEVDEAFEPRLGRVLSESGSVVKESPAKLVTYHQSDGGGGMYVKRYRNTGMPFRTLKTLFKESHARREWRLANEIALRGIPVVRHLALGERRSALGVEESILVTESFPGEPLCSYAKRGDPAVQAMLGQFMRKMHDEGVLQFDLYGNILVREDPLEMRRVDVHHARLKSALSERERLDNLAFLGTEVSLTESFYRAYGWTGEMASRTHARSLEMRRSFYARRAKRCFRENNDFTPMRLGELRCWVRRAAYDERLKAVLANPDAAIEGGTSLKRGRSATVAATDGVVIKRFNLRRATNLVKNCFRQSRARLAFQRAYHLELVGVPTARGAAAAELRFGPFLLRSYFVMDEVPGAVDLAGYRGDTRTLAVRTAELLGKLHNEGFSNRDMKETNILVDREARPVLIDLEGLRFHGTVPRKKVLADLARFGRGVAKLPHFSRADRVRFLRVYCRVRGIRPKALRGKR